MSRHHSRGTIISARAYSLKRDVQDDERSENCVTAVEEVAGVCGDGDVDSGAGDWGERGGFQRAERRGAEAGECAACAEPLHGAARPVSVSVVPGLCGPAGSKSDVRKPDDVQHPGSGRGGYGRECVDCMAVPGERELL